MSYNPNPFLGRKSEDTTSEQEFVQLFSPRILELLPEGQFRGTVHIFRSPPGSGKTTLFRAFTPSVLQAFWNTKNSAPDQRETYQWLREQKLCDDKKGPQLLGVLLSCASGYADLPPGASVKQEGLFRAIFDCRVVLRSLRTLTTLRSHEPNFSLENIEIRYSDSVENFQSIPKTDSALDLLKWAESRERDVYSQLDSITDDMDNSMPQVIQFESILWLKSVRFYFEGEEVAPLRLLMIDDLHKLRKKQRSLLIDELVVLRSGLPIWLAERNIAISDQLISQGIREGRDLNEYNFEDFLQSPSGATRFPAYAQNILERRLRNQNLISPAPFSNYLRSELYPAEIKEKREQVVDDFLNNMRSFRTTPKYSEWFSKVDELLDDTSYEALLEIVSIRILIFRCEGNRQKQFEFTPLTTDELTTSIDSSIRNTARIFLREKYKIPYYYGIDTLCSLATNNVEELLSIAAEYYEGLSAKKILRKEEVLTPEDQEKHVLNVAKRKHSFIPKAHTQGMRAQQLLDSIGSFCREKTFQPNAPYAPGVTGIRLSGTEISKLDQAENKALGDLILLRKVLSECVAENLITKKASSATRGRESGTVFYLNRTLCAYYGLPIQRGGWQDIPITELASWMKMPRKMKQQKLLEI